MSNTLILLAHRNRKVWKGKKCEDCGLEFESGMSVVSHRVGMPDPKYGRGNIARRAARYYCRDCWEKKYIDSDDEGLDQIEMTILQLVDGRWIAEKVRGEASFHKTVHSVGS